MATSLRKTDQSVTQLARAVNDLKAYVVSLHRAVAADLGSIDVEGFEATTASAGSHNDRSERTVTAANATDLATSLVLVNQLRAVYEFHRKDTLAHDEADTTNVIAAPKATDLTTAIALANEIKGDYNAHRSASGVHAENDSSNSVTATNASDQSSLNTLLNEIKTDLNAHLASGPVAKSIRAVQA